MQEGPLQPINQSLFFAEFSAITGKMTMARLKTIAMVAANQYKALGLRFECFMIHNIQIDLLIFAYESPSILVLYTISFISLRFSLRVELI